MKMLQSKNIILLSFHLFHGKKIYNRPLYNYSLNVNYYTVFQWYMNLQFSGSWVVSIPEMSEKVLCLLTIILDLSPYCRNSKRLTNSSIVRYPRFCLSQALNSASKKFVWWLSEALCPFLFKFAIKKLMIPSIWIQFSIDL